MEALRAGWKTAYSRIKILVAGLGNAQLMDDGVGIHIARELRRRGMAQASVIDVGTEVMEASHVFEEADKILAIDAMKAGGLPGTIYSHTVFELEMPSLRSSVHQPGLIGVLRSLPPRRGREVKILGIEPAIITNGGDLSPVLREALPLAVRIAEEIVSCWISQGAGRGKYMVR